MHQHYHHLKTTAVGKVELYFTGQRSQIIKIPKLFAWHQGRQTKCTIEHIMYMRHTFSEIVACCICIRTYGFPGKLINAMIQNKECTAKSKQQQQANKIDKKYTNKTKLSNY